MKKLLYFTLFTSLFSVVHSQTDTVFAKVYWSDAGYKPSSLVFTNSEDLIMTGSYNYQGHLSSIDSVGEVNWSKSLSSLSSSVNGCELYESIETSDSCIVVVGSLRRQSDNKMDAFCLKINQQGDTLWTRTFNEPTSVLMGAYSVIQSIDSNLLICGHKFDNSGSFLIKLDLDGNVIWKTQFTTPNGCAAKGITEGADSTIYLAGTSMDLSPDPGSFICAANYFGQVQWLKTYSTITMYDIIEKNNSLYTVSYNNSNSTCSFLKADLSGSVIWAKDAGYWNNFNQTKLHIRELQNGNLVSVYGDQFMTSEMIVLNENGILQTSNWVFMAGVDVAETNEKGLFIAGFGPIYGVKALLPYEHSGIVKTDSLYSETPCSFTSSITLSDFTGLSGSTLFSESNTLLIQNTPLLFADISVLNDLGCVDFYGGINENESSPDVSVYPTVSDAKYSFEQEDGLPITLTISDSFGRPLLHKTSSNGLLDVDLSSCAPGTYYYLVSIDGRNTKTGKLILIR